VEWQDTLIRLYLYVCARYRSHLGNVAQRLSNNDKPQFTDQELLTVYLFGLLEQKRTLQQIYDDTRKHLHDWFPRLPSYVGFVQRLNRLADVFPLLAEAALSDCGRAEVVETVRLVDSMPVLIAQQRRSSRARVAAGFATKGYCSSKNLYYYGVKVHLIAFRRRGTMPLPDYIGMTPGSAHDLGAVRGVVSHLQDGELYGDKIYADRELVQRLEREQRLRLYTPVKKQKGQAELTMTDRAFSEAVSRVRQPIESLFNWIEEKTGIETASKVRSFEGLMVHVFGRIAAAMILLAFYP